MIRHARPQIDGRKQSLLSRSVAFGNRVAMVDTASLNRRATDASALPTNRQICGGPIRVWQSGAFDFTTPRLSRNWFGIVSGLSRDWFGSLSRKFRLELGRNWFGIVSGFPRERLGEVGERFLVENCKKSYVFCDFCRFICIYAKNVVPLQTIFKGIKKDCKNIRNEDCIIPYSKTTIY